ncbi:peroxisome biogenesis factor 6 [Protopterus annectens]|uniref:peroxisome biogenesis factor 6 n=1 Tax=Protopterus annectens TaxID=7888 RepID=UPI001CF9D6D2|nr:peroxisome biogenesis factor 6 [Protopterus annectens]
MVCQYFVYGICLAKVLVNLLSFGYYLWRLYVQVLEMVILDSHCTSVMSGKLRLHLCLSSRLPSELHPLQLVLQSPLSSTQFASHSGCQPQSVHLCHFVDSEITDNAPDPSGWFSSSSILAVENYSWRGALLLVTLATAHSSKQEGTQKWDQRSLLEEGRHTETFEEGKAAPFTEEKERRPVESLLCKDVYGAPRTEREGYDNLNDLREQMGPQAAETGGFTEEDRLFQLHGNRLFFKHYGFQPEEQVQAHVIRQPVSLSKVVLGARSKSSLRWASSETFANGLLMLAYQKQYVLARQGDVLIASYHPLFGDDIAQVFHYLLDLVVLECQPVLQGVLSVHTNVVVTDYRETPSYPLAVSGDLPNYGLRSLQPVYASDFAHCAISLSSSSSCLSCVSALDLQQPISHINLRGFLQALECRVEVRVTNVAGLLNQNQINVHGELVTQLALDIDSCLFVSKNTLLKLGLFNLEWVSLAIHTSSLEKVKLARTTSFQVSQHSEESKEEDVKGNLTSWRLAKIVVLEFPRGQDLDFPDHVGLVSSAFWFNISRAAPIPTMSRTLKLKRCYDCNPSMQKLNKCSASQLSTPPAARELHIDVVVSPDYSVNSNYNRILVNHFKVPRLVYVGDVLCVSTVGHAEFLEGGTFGILRWPVLYFKVKKISGFEEGEVNAGFVADTLHTSVYLVATVNSYVPTCHPNSGHAFWNSWSPPGLSNVVEKLHEIIYPYLHHTRDSSLTVPCSILIQGPSGSGKKSAVQVVCNKLNLHILKVDCVSLCGDTSAITEVKLQGTFLEAELVKPCVLLMSNIQLLGRDRDGASEDPRAVSAFRHLITKMPKNSSGYPVVVIGTASGHRELLVDVQTAFLHEVTVDTPMEEQRRAMLGALTSTIPLGKDVNLNKLAKHTAGFVLGDYCTLLSYTARAACSRVLKHCFAGVITDQGERDICAAGIPLLSEDFSLALEQLHHVNSQAIGAPKIPTVHWSDVGGLQDVKKEILDTIQLPLEHPEMLSVGLRRSGLLLYGPPGTGKTLLAKAVATECSMTFLSVKGPELINMYVGQSEQNVREVFSKARAAAPCIIFFDELDSLAPNRGRSGDSGGVMDRVVSQLLAELDGLHSSKDVFVIGATNRPDLLDPALLRPGRFDRLLYVGLSEDRESQLKVLKAITRKFKLDQAVSLTDVIQKCPAQLTGADMYALCSDARILAIKRKIGRIHDGLDTEESELILTTDDFLQAAEKLQPSVSEQELLNYRVLKQKFSSR